jgi:hypothetical protein
LAFERVLDVISSGLFSNVFLFLLDGLWGCLVEVVIMVGKTGSGRWAIYISGPERLIHCFVHFGVTGLVSHSIGGGYSLLWMHVGHIISESWRNKLRRAILIYDIIARVLRILT